MLTRPSAAAGLAALLIGTGVLHFAVPAPFDSIVPDQLPGSPRLWTYAFGVVELATAATLAIPRTRRWGGLLATALFVVVFPANIKMAVDWSDGSVLMRVVGYGRLPLQIPLVLWALHVHRVALRPA